MNEDELLIPRSSSANERLRNELLTRTARRIRFERWARIAIRICVCLALFAAGAATTSFRPPPEREVVYVPVREEVTPAPKADPEKPKRPRSPVELELAAEQGPVKAESARKFREAGDVYLRDYADYRSALRCYRNFLDSAEAADLIVNPDDTWLLTSLKRAREQENTQ
jgi:hypothetical protein